MSQNNFNNLIYEALTQKNNESYCAELIQDLVNGAGYSYSRIAYHIGVSPSAIQKLATNYSRKPRYKTFYNLLAMHYEIFHGPNSLPHVKSYLRQKEAQSHKKASKKEVLT